MIVLLPVFLTATVLWLVYWAIVRPSILDSIEDDIATLKHRISWSIINDDPGARSKSAQQLLDEVNSNQFIRLISFGQVIVYLLKYRAKVKAAVAREVEVFESSPKWIREARELNARLTIKAALVNSPTWWVPLAVILLAALFSKQVLDWWNEAENTAIHLRSANTEVC